MKIHIQHKYIVLPVNTNMVSKKIRLIEDGNLIFDFDCKVDAVSPKHKAYVDVERFIGKTVEITINPHMNVEIGFSDVKEYPNLWRESLRPKIHFTVKSGYNNDPNGLIYHKGVYHMFYQHNPCSNQWGNMHWGHAISTDLIHWEEQDCALFPDELGTMFSGCAIEDKKNCTGICQDDSPAMLLFYTAAGNENIISKGRLFTQCLAYSVDGGKSFLKYKGNPIIEHIADQNRDPKVVWVDEINKYVMVIYLTEDLYRMLSSTDLLNWTPFQDIHIRGERECPDLYSIMCDGEKKWVLSGGSDYYVVGRFTKNAYVIDASERRLTFSAVSYAAQSFSGMEDGRVVRIWWDKNRTRFFDHRFSQQMSIPVEMRLNKIDDRYYLSALPVEEISGLYKENIVIENKVLTEPVRLNVGINPLDISLKMPYVNDTCVTLSIFGAKIRLDTTQNNLLFERLKMPISLRGDAIYLRVVVDTCSVEIFTDNGHFCLSEWFVCDPNLPYVEISASSEVKILDLSCHVLESIHEDK